MRRVRATIAAVEKELVLRNVGVCVCSLCYPARNAHGPNFNLWPVSVYKIFPNSVTNGIIFEKNCY